MTETVLSDPLARHRIPVIDRMMDVLSLLERRPAGVLIRDIVEQVGLPRTTVYRILNTLQHHDVVCRTSNGGYRLGPRLMALAARAVSERHDYDLAAVSLPHLERLAAETGEGCKISVVDGDGLVVVAAADGKGDYALTVVPGQRMPLHAGAAGKVLLAYLPKAEIEERIGGPLSRYTPRTFTDPKKLAAELARIRRQGWAEDKGEYSPSILAFAAPVHDRSGRAVAALSIPFLAGTKRPHADRLRLLATAVANVISTDLRGRPRVSRASSG
jgi:DNA-binding IclR family transcriptional regulator